MCEPGADGGETDDAAAADGGRPAMAGAGGELHGESTNRWVGKVPSHPGPGHMLRLNPR